MIIQNNKGKPQQCNKLLGKSLETRLGKDNMQ